MYRDDTSLAEQVADDLPPGRALDLATGRGRVAYTLADRGWTVDAIDISRAMLDRARSQTPARSDAINWILADVDSYCFPAVAYDLVTIRFFDARDRLGAINATLKSGGVLVYEHRLQSAPESGSGNPYHFSPNELLDACSTLRVRYYAEDPDRSLVRLVAAAPPAASIG